MWETVLIGAAGCYALKVVGSSLPARVVEHPLVHRIVMLLPIALLSALVAVQTVGAGQSLVLDARLPALGAAALALQLRRGFITVVAVAALTAALLRHTGLTA